jgi:ribosomal protein L32
MRFLILLFTLFSFLNANHSNTEALAKSLHLSAASKAIVQWERVFKSKKKMKRYRIDTLSLQERTVLKKYLIRHAIDSDQPTIAGI